MMALILTGIVSFLMIRKTPKHYLLFVVILLIAARMTGPDQRKRFMSTFNDTEDRDPSAASRLDLWGNCWQLMKSDPLLGIGPRHFPTIAHTFGWNRGKEAHSLWLQLGAEVGLPGLGALLLFYGLTAWRLFPLAREKIAVPDPAFVQLACGVIASLVGFVISAQFVTLIGLETPYYVALIGAGVLKLTSQAAQRTDTDAYGIVTAHDLDQSDEDYGEPIGVAESYRDL
jgi:O-antigen ligase